MPDGDGLVWRQVDHGLGGEEPVDLSFGGVLGAEVPDCLLYTSPSPRDS